MLFFRRPPYAGSSRIQRGGSFQTRRPRYAGQKPAYAGRRVSPPTTRSASGGTCPEVGDFRRARGCACGLPIDFIDSIVCFFSILRPILFYVSLTAFVFVVVCFMDFSRGVCCCVRAAGFLLDLPIDFIDSIFIIFILRPQNCFMSVLPRARKQ